MLRSRKNSGSSTLSALSALSSLSGPRIDNVNKAASAHQLLGTCASKLVRLILLQHWKKVHHLLATKRGVEQAKKPNEFQDCLPILSMAASRNAPAEIIKTILAIDPSLSLQVDIYEMLPLHIACLNGASSETIKALLDHDIGACAQAIDTFKRTPLHYAVQYVCEPEPQASDIYSTRSGSTCRSAMSKRKGNNSLSSMMTMSRSRFHDQMRVIQLLLEAGPDIVMFADGGNRTPIDIVQDCKAHFEEGSKWERADIVCEMLRKMSVSVYMEQKLASEIVGYQCEGDAADIPLASSANTRDSATTSCASGASGLSQMEIDCTSLNQMEVSVSDVDNSYTHTMMTYNAKEYQESQTDTDDVEMESI